MTLLLTDFLTIWPTYFWYLFWNTTPYGARARGPYSKIMQFWQNKNGHHLPNSLSEKKVQKTEKFSLNELHLRCAKMFDLRWKLETLGSKNWFYTFLYFMAPINRSWHFICYQGPVWGFFYFFSSQPHCHFPYFPIGYDEPWKFHVCGLPGPLKRGGPNRPPSLQRT